MALQAGQLNRRVIIQTVTLTTDAGGGATETWADTATVWARVQTLPGNEALQAMQVASSLKYLVTIRKRTVTPQQRIKYGTRILKIRSIPPDELGEYLELLCEEEHV